MLKGEFKKSLPILAKPLPVPLRKTEIEMRRLSGLAMVLHSLGNSREAMATNQRRARWPNRTACASLSVARL